MIYDELIKRLRECTAEMNGEKTLWHQAADAIENLENRLNLWRQDKIRRWIPVTERLPEEYEYVLCKTDYGMEVGYHRDEWGQDEWTTGNFGDGTIDVSHWMLLPEPPESDDSLSCGIRKNVQQKSTVDNGACSADEPSEKVQDG